MTFTRRQKLTVISLLLYWPAVFILTHIPVSQKLLESIGTSDKTLHYLAYLILIFLLWFAVSPNAKVNWRRATVWWVLLVVVWYGVADEWLQVYVKRSPDVIDFLADLTGALTGLVLLSIFPFWPASIVLTAVVIFIVTNLTQINLVNQYPLINAAFHFLAYAFFSLLWIRYIYHFLPIKPPQSKWLIGVLVLPIGFMLAVEAFYVIAGNDFRLQNVIISAAAVAAVALTIYLIALFRRRFTQNRLPGDFEGPV